MHINSEKLPRIWLWMNPLNFMNATKLRTEEFFEYEMISQSGNCFCPLKDTMAHVLAIYIGVRGVYLSHENG